MKSNRPKLTPRISSVGPIVLGSAVVGLIALAVLLSGRFSSSDRPLAPPEFRIPADGTASTDIAGRDLLEEVIHRLDSHHSISAKVRFQSAHSGESVAGEGGYLQLGSGHRRMYHLWLDGSEGGPPLAMSQSVSDHGQTLWSRWQLPLGNRFHRVDLDKVRHAMRQTRSAADPGDLAAGPTMQTLTLGALPEVMERAKSQFRFEPAEEWAAGENRFFVLRGELSPDRLKKLLPDQAESIDQGSFDRWDLLPENQPHRIVLLLGRESLFPHRLLLERYGVRKEKGKRIVTPPQTFLLVDLLDVRLDEPLQLSQFDPAHFHPAADRKDALDVTQAYLQRYLK